MKKTFLVCLLALCASLLTPGIASPVLAAAGGNLSLHFDSPAKDWEREGLPIGNGQMGLITDSACGMRWSIHSPNCHDGSFQ